MAAATKYKAFISYSHRDRDWGNRLHRALERYRIPKHLALGAGRDGPLPTKLFPIFRDREELPSSANLNTQIATALEQSAYLIVICSPNSAKSRWVNEEIVRFKRLGRDDRILAFIVAGEPNATDKPGLGAADECFPPALRYALDEAGQPAGEPLEPIAADARPVGDGEVNAILKLIAGLLGVGFDDLRRRELEAQRARSRVRAAIAAGFGIVVTGALAAGWIAWQRAEIAEERRVKAQLEQSLKLAAVARGQHAAGNPVRASLIAAEALPLRRPGPISPEAEGALVAGYAESTWLLGPVMLHDDQVMGASFVDEGSRILTYSYDDTRRLWDAETGALLAEYKAPADGEVVYSTSLSPDRKRLTAVGESSVRLFDLEGRRMIARLVHDGTIRRAFFAAGGKLVATSTEQGSIRLWNGETGAPVGETIDLRFPGTQDLFQPNQIALNHDGSRLIVVNVDGNVQVWDTATPRRLADPRKHSGGAAFSRDGSRILLAMNNSVELWDADMKERQAELEHDGSVSSVLFSDDASLIATVSALKGDALGEVAYIWDAATRQRRASLEHERRIMTLEFNADGTRLVTVADDDTARMWETTAGRLVGTVIKDDKYSPFRGASDGRGSGWEHSGALRDAQFSPDGRHLVVASLNGYAQVWDARLFTPDPGTVVPGKSEPQRLAMTPSNPARLDPARRRAAMVRTSHLEIVDLTDSSNTWRLDNDRGFTAAEFSPDGGYLIVTSPARRLAAVIDIATRQRLIQAEHRRPVESVDFHAGRSLLLTADREATYLWDAAARKFLRAIEQRSGPTLARFSPDGTRVLTAAGDGTVRLWDTESGAALAKPMQHDFDFRSNFYRKIPIAIFNPPGTRILTVSDATLRLWDTATGDLVAARAHGAEIRTALYSADGRAVLTASADGTARLWDAATLAPAAVLRHRTAVFSADLDSSGERIVTLSWGTGATVWDVASAAPLGRMKAVAPVAFARDGLVVLETVDNGAVVRWDVAASLAPSQYRAAVAYLASFPGLSGSDRARYLSDAGVVDPDALPGRDPCDVVVAGMSWRYRPSRNAAVSGMSFLDPKKEALRLCEDSAKAYPNEPRFAHNQALILLSQGRKPEALEAFRRAASKGHLPATLAMGKLYLDGSFSGADKAKAVETYREASKRGLPAADSELAELYWRGEAVDSDRARALALWRGAALRGEIGAARRLAEMEESGAEPEVPRDLRAALLHWALAVELGDRAGTDDRFARARRASLARHFSRLGEYETIAGVWQEALKASSPAP